MQEPEDTTYVNDDSVGTIVLTTNIEKGTYKLDRDARVCRACLFVEAFARHNR